MYPPEDQKKEGWDPNLPVTEQSVGVLSKVTFEKACLLAKLGITTIGDLFFNTPIRYEDRRNVKTIDSIGKGDEALILGTVKACEMKKCEEVRNFLRALYFTMRRGIYLHIGGIRAGLWMFLEKVSWLFYTGKHERYIRLNW